MKREGEKNIESWSFKSTKIELNNGLRVLTTLVYNCYLSKCLKLSFCSEPTEGACSMSLERDVQKEKELCNGEGQEIDDLNRGRRIVRESRKSNLIPKPLKPENFFDYELAQWKQRWCNRLIVLSSIQEDSMHAFWLDFSIARPWPRLTYRYMI